MPDPQEKESKSGRPKVTPSVSWGHPEKGLGFTLSVVFCSCLASVGRVCTLRPDESAVGRGDAVQKLQGPVAVD